MLTDKTRKAILDLQAEYPGKRSALIPALHMAQNEKGYLSHETQAEVAALFDLAPNEVHAVVSFYDMFHEHPVGKNLLHVCKNLSCMLRGSDALIKSLCKKLDIQPGETTKDGQFTLIPCECLAACDKAPMMLVNEDLVGCIQESDIDRILEEAKHSGGHHG